MMKTLTITTKIYKKKVDVIHLLISGLKTLMILKSIQGSDDEGAHKRGAKYSADRDLQDPH